MSNLIHIDQYIMYGLNRNRSFPCTFEGKGKTVSLPTEKALERFAVKCLKPKDCQSAIFIVHNDGTYGAYLKIYHNDEGEAIAFEDDEGDLVLSFAICTIPRGDDRHLFAKLDGDFRFCCYTILLEKEDGIYEVCR